MTLFNFNLPLDLPLELAIDAVSDYSPHSKVHFILTHWETTMSSGLIHLKSEKPSC